MADSAMADIANIDRGEYLLTDRPFHTAYLQGKLPCPHSTCKHDARHIFFHENGLPHHFRIKHSGVTFTDQQTKQAQCLLRMCHGQETKIYLENMSAARRNLKTEPYVGYNVSTSYEDCNDLYIAAKDSKDAAKLAGMALMHFGYLKPYTKGNKPEIVEVNGGQIVASFNTWYSTKKELGEEMTIIIAEAIFVKKDLYIEATPLQSIPNSSETSVNIDMPSGDQALDVLHGVLKLQNFRGMQKDAIDSIMSRKNTLLIMPTGGGKTVCYVVPGLLCDKLTVVIFPLLSLLIDQCQRLRSKGILVCYLMSEMDQKERDSVFHKLTTSPLEYKFLFLTPETVLSQESLGLLQDVASKGLLNFIVIDEAHCIDSWGFHFRPSYHQLWKLTEFGQPILAMTGTATMRTQRVIIDHLHIPGANVLRQSSDRPNLVFRVVENQGHNHSYLVDLIKKDFDGKCGIVYCQLRKDTVEVAYQLQKSGLNAAFYHAGLDVFRRKEISESWKAGHIHVICATVAFGMGIDKKDVNFVIHNGIPCNIESYVQESGRAGRDGTEAHCIIFFKFEDRIMHLRNISLLPDGDQKKQSVQNLNDMVSYCLTPLCRKSQIVNYFDGKSSTTCKEKCDVCLQPPNPPVDGTEHAKSVVACVQSMQTMDSNLNMKDLVLTYRGSKSKAIVSKGYSNAENHGKGTRDFNKKTICRFVHFLIMNGILEEKTRPVTDTRTTPILVLGDKVSSVSNADFTFVYYK